MSRALRSVVALGLVAVGVGLGVGAGGCAKPDGELAGPPPAVEAPLALLVGKPTLAGPPVDPAALAGKVVAINFWSPG